MKVVFVLGGAGNVYLAVRALVRGHDTWMFGAERVDRRDAPFAFWFYSVFCQGAAGLALLAVALFY